MVLTCRRGQQYGRRAIDGGRGGAGGSSGDRFIGHRGTFCQDFTDYLLMLLLVVVGSNGAAAAAAATAGIASGAGAGWVAVWDFLAAARIDYIHDPRRTKQDPTPNLSGDRSIRSIRLPGSRKICGGTTAKAGLRMCVGFQP